MSTLPLYYPALAADAVRQAESDYPTTGWLSTLILLGGEVVHSATSPCSKADQLLVKGATPSPVSAATGLSLPRACPDCDDLDRTSQLLHLGFAVRGLAGHNIALAQLVDDLDADRYSATPLSSKGFCTRGWFRVRKHANFRITVANAPTFTKLKTMGDAGQQDWFDRQLNLQRALISRIAQHFPVGVFDERLLLVEDEEDAKLVAVFGVGAFEKVQRAWNTNDPQVLLLTGSRFGTANRLLIDVTKDPNEVLLAAARQQPLPAPGTQFKVTDVTFYTVPSDWVGLTSPQVIVLGPATGSSAVVAADALLKRGDLVFREDPKPGYWARS